MAYKELLGTYCANTKAALDVIWAQMVEMGWTEIDAQASEGSCAPADVNTTNETITIVGHSFVNGEHVQYYNAGTPIGGLTNWSFYYIVQVSGDTFKLSATQGGGAVNLSSQGVGTHYFREGYRVYSSDGETTKPTQYVMIGRLQATYITAKAYYKWDASTHIGYGTGSSYPGWLTINETGFYLWVYGNKDWVTCVTKVGTTYYYHMFGWSIPYWTVQTTLTDDATSGSNVVLNVDDSSDFVVGKKYQIWGIANEGRDTLTVTAKGAGTITVSNLPRNYGTGAIFGMLPSTFGHGYGNYTSMQWVPAH